MNINIFCLVSLVPLKYLNIFSINIAVCLEPPHLVLYLCVPGSK